MSSINVVNDLTLEGYSPPRCSTAPGDHPDLGQDGTVHRHDAVVSDLPYSRGDAVALMVNGLGGTPISELYLLYGYAQEQLAKRGISVRRNYVRNYCTSLDMAGTSITLSRLDPEVEELLAAPAEIAIRTF